jgi:PmbA protein
MTEKSATIITSEDNILAEQSRLQNVLQDILVKATQKGASSAEVGTSIDMGFTTVVRMGEVETVEYHRDKAVGVTVYFGQRKGSASTSDLSFKSLEETLEAACSIAKYTSEDPYAGLAEKDLMAWAYPDLDLYHPWDLTVEQSIAMATQCEAVGRGYDKRIMNSEGVSINTSRGIYGYANTHGMLGGYPITRHSISCTLIASESGQMQRDYDYTVARAPLELLSYEEVAKKAAKRALRRLKAQRLPTKKVPVIFVANMARGIIGSFLAAIRGGNLYRKSSFLVNALGKKIFPNHISLKEEPHLKKALGSVPFDQEGVATHPRVLVDEGILQGYVLDSYSARKLGLQTTGNAGGIHNLLMTSSDKDFHGLLKAMGRGVVITELMGHGVNILTGDYSRGMFGFWVENGEIQFPIEEVTVAGNLRDMLQKIVLVGNDVDIRGAIRTGSIFIEEMTIAGS